jgi:hypothetical protein
VTTGISEGFDFSVRLAGGVVPALADQMIASDQQSAHGGVR